MGLHETTWSLITKLEAWLCIPSLALFLRPEETGHQEWCSPPAELGVGSIPQKFPVLVAALPLPPLGLAQVCAPRLQKCNQVMGLWSTICTKPCNSMVFSPLTEQGSVPFELQGRCAPLSINLDVIWECILDLWACFLKGLSQELCVVCTLKYLQKKIYIHSLKVCAGAQSFTQQKAPYGTSLDWIMTTVSAPTLSWSLFLHEPSVHFETRCKITEHCFPQAPPLRWCPN